MSYRLSNICKDLACALLISGAFFITSCQDNGKQSGTTSGDSTQVSETDTTHNGLEGTRDQAAATVSTDVITDSSSGQSPKKGQTEKK